MSRCVARREAYFSVDQSAYLSLCMALLLEEGRIESATTVPSPTHKPKSRKLKRRVPQDRFRLLASVNGIGESSRLNWHSALSISSCHTTEVEKSYISSFRISHFKGAEPRICERMSFCTQPQAFIRNEEMVTLYKRTVSCEAKLIYLHITGRIGPMACLKSSCVRICISSEVESSAVTPTCSSCVADEDCPSPRAPDSRNRQRSVGGPTRRRMP